LTLLLAQNSIPTDADTADEGVEVTAIAQDAQNTAVSGVKISFGVSKGVLAVTADTTDSSGEAKAVVHTGGGLVVGDQIIVTAKDASGAVVAPSKTILVVAAASNPTPASLTLLASSPQLSSDAEAVTAGVDLTAIVKDANNNVIPNVGISFTTQDSAEIIAANPVKTDANGRAGAKVTTGGDPQNRVINVAASAGNLTRSVAIEVVGTQLDITGIDSTQINVKTPYTITLLDAAGEGIPGKAVTVSTNAGNTLSGSSFVTNSAGQATVELTATVANSRLTATALGLTAVKDIKVSTDEFVFLSPASDSEINIGNSPTLTVRWRQSNTPVPDGTRVDFTATRGTLSAASGTTTNGIATVSISSNQSGFTQVMATSTQLSKPTASLALEFVAVTPSRITVQGIPANLSVNQSAEITATVFDASDNLVKNAVVDYSLVDITGGTLSSSTAVTNSQGIARVIYTASSAASSADGVKITGRVRGTSIEATTLLTVGSRAVSIKFGAGAELVNKDLATYQDPWTVIVDDASGNPVADAEFTLAIQSVLYYKGERGALTAGCLNEDVNLNDNLDTGEDINTNTILDPGRPASVPRTVTLDKDGAGQFFVTYPKDYGEFVRVRIIGTIRVGGTESRQTRDYDLRVTRDDRPKLQSRSPYGVEGDGDVEPTDGTVDPGCFNTR